MRCNGLSDSSGMRHLIAAMPAGDDSPDGARAGGAALILEKGTEGARKVGNGQGGRGRELPCNGEAQGKEGQEQQQAVADGPGGGSSPLSNMDMVWLANIATRNARKAS